MFVFIFLCIKINESIIYFYLKNNRLFKKIVSQVVQKSGGYNRVTNQNQWKTIADKMGFHPVTTSITNLCKQAYKKYVIRSFYIVFKDAINHAITSEWTYVTSYTKLINA